MINETVNRIPVLVLDKAGRSSVRSCLEGLDCPSRMAVEATVRGVPYGVFIMLAVILGAIVLVMMREDKGCIKA